jgi:hypothetical protein
MTTLLVLQVIILGLIFQAQMDFREVAVIVDKFLLFQYKILLMQ